MTKVKGEKPIIDVGDYPTLKETLRTLAPEIFEPTPDTGAEKKKKRPDAYRTDAPPTLFSNEDETTASSISPRQRPTGGGMSAHALRANLQAGQSVPTSAKPKQYDVEDLDALEYEAEVDDLEELDEEDESDEAQKASNEYLYDLVADQYKDNMEAFMRGNQASVHVRGEDLWHERYRYDVRNDHDHAESKEHISNQEADRISTERALEAQRLNAEADARAATDRQRMNDDYLRRLAEDRNRR